MRLHRQLVLCALPSVYRTTRWYAIISYRSRTQSCPPKCAGELREIEPMLTPPKPKIYKGPRASASQTTDPGPTTFFITPVLCILSATGEGVYREVGRAPVLTPPWQRNPHVPNLLKALSLSPNPYPQPRNFRLACTIRSQAGTNYLFFCGCHASRLRTSRGSHRPAEQTLPQQH